MKSKSWRALIWLPVIAVAVVVIVLNAWSIVHRLTLPYTQSPWESSIILDAHRASHGQSIYKRLTDTGRATHIYGPLITHAVATGFRITGPNLYTARAINTVAALIACAMVIAIFVDYRKPFDLIFSAAMVLSLHYRSRAYFVESRPDMAGWLFAMLALVCFYRAHQREQFLKWYLPGLAMVSTCFLFKQTYSCCAAVPLLATLIVRPPSIRRHLAFATLPLAWMGVMLLALRVLAPNLNFYIVTVPQAYGIDRSRVVLGLDILIMYMPLFPAAAIAGYLLGTRCDARIAWLIAAIVIGSAAGLAAFAKPFATFNSLLLGWIPMTAFCLAVVPNLLRRLNERTQPLLLSLGVSSFVAYLLYVTAFSTGKDQWNWNLAHGTHDYPRVIEAVRQINGATVICPEDPTIPLFANGYVGRSIEAELDATMRSGIPANMVNEIAKARWLVRVEAGYPEPRLTAKFMKQMGFKRKRNIGRAYSLWYRAPTAATTQSTTAPAG